ncbi:MAG: hypothetical protein M0Q94_05560 [Candidatus Cloacimonetes bacterium]|nr:hypothetical protein [Candidatus Cloacimonadota bacterium]
MQYDNLKDLLANKIYYLVIIIILFLIVNNTLLAKDLTVENLPDSLYIGQIIDLEFNLEEYKPENIFFQANEENQQIEIYDVTPVKGKPWHYLLRIAPFDTGLVQVNKIPLFIQSIQESKAVYDTLMINPFSFYVQSALSLTDTTIVDIFAPSNYKLKFFDYLFPIILIIIIVITIYLLRKFIKKFKNKEKINPIFVDNRPAWLKAIELIEKLKVKNYINSKNFLEFYFELSYILRFFIENQFRIKALEMTTPELKRYFQGNLNNILKANDNEVDTLSNNSLLLENNYNEILKILSSMDRVKFAKHSIDEKEAIDSLNWVESYVNLFKDELIDKERKKTNTKFSEDRSE